MLQANQHESSGTRRAMSELNEERPPPEVDPAEAKLDSSYLAEQPSEAQTEITDDHRGFRPLAKASLNNGNEKRNDGNEFFQVGLTFR